MADESQAEVQLNSAKGMSDSIFKSGERTYIKNRQPPSIKNFNIKNINSALKELSVDGSLNSHIPFQ